MAGWSLERLGFHAGVWQGRLSGPPGAALPDIEVSAGGAPLPGIETAPDGAAAWVISVPVPPGLLSDGTTVFLLRDAAIGAELGQFAVTAGEPADDDLRAEVALLRAELDMLKKVVRRIAAKPQ